MGGLEGRELDNFPFLQGIKDLLSTPSRNLVIEEVFRGDIDKALEEGDVNESKEVESIESFARMRMNYQIRWWIWPS